jgi:hypothetical protein
VAKHPPELIRRGFEQEVRSERDNCIRAVKEAGHQLAQAQLALADGKVPLRHLRQLVTEAAEAYQRAAAWAALNRVEFMLPDVEAAEG